MDDYIKDFISELDEGFQYAARAEPRPANEILFERAVELFEKNDLFRDIEPSFVRARGPRGREMGLWGYAEDPIERSLLIFCGVATPEHAGAVSVDMIRRELEGAKAFVESAANGWIVQNLELTSDEVAVARRFAEVKDTLHRVRFIFLTNGLFGVRRAAINLGEVMGLSSSVQLFDIDALAEMNASSRNVEPIVINFTKWLEDGLPTIGALEGNGETDTYVGIIPGRVLAEIFDEYGSRLLEANVRTFLSARGKVNRGIQETLEKDPLNFVAFNNGITTTAESMTAAEEGQVNFIETVTGLQIVNGAQTTSSLVHFLRRKKNGNLDGVEIVIKIVLVREDKAEGYTSLVSRYANSQNPVRPADFFASSEFHVRLEQLSRQIKAPAVNGPLPTHWYYERARGQYEFELSGLSGAKKKQYEITHPKSQRIVKTDWAKYQNCWLQRPHDVSKGAETNFQQFAQFADKEWTEKNEKFGEQYFKDGVALAILFESTRKKIRSSSWYAGGYLANLTAYAISKLAYILDHSEGQHLDLDKIWRLQAISPELADYMEELARGVMGVLTDPRRPQGNVTQWAKQPACWTKVKALPAPSLASIENDLAGMGVIRERQEKSAEKTAAKSWFDDVEKLMRIPGERYSTILARGVGALLPREVDAIKASVLVGKPPSEMQARKIYDGLDRLESSGLMNSADIWGED